MNILIVSIEQFRDLLSYQIESADLIIIDQGNSAFIYKNKYDVVSQYPETWENATRIIINTISRKHAIYLPDLKKIAPWQTQKKGYN